MGHEPSLLPLRRLKSQHLGKQSSPASTHLSFPTMASALELTLSHRPSTSEAWRSPLLRVLVVVHCWHQLMKFGSPYDPALALHLPWHFALSESFSLRSRSLLPCLTLRQRRLQLAGLEPLMGKASVSNISVLPWARRRPKSPWSGLFVSYA